MSDWFAKYRTWRLLSSLTIEFFFHFFFTCIKRTRLTHSPPQNFFIFSNPLSSLHCSLSLRRSSTCRSRSWTKPVTPSSADQIAPQTNRKNFSWCVASVKSLLCFPQTPLEMVKERKKTKQAGDVDLILRMDESCWFEYIDYYWRMEPDLCVWSVWQTERRRSLFVPPPPPRFLPLSFSPSFPPPHPGLSFFRYPPRWFTGLTHHSSAWQSRWTTGLVITHFCLSPLVIFLNTTWLQPFDL